MGSEVSRPQNYRGSRYATTTKKVPRRMSMGAPPRPPAIRVGGSTGFLDVDAIALAENVENQSEASPSDGRLSLSIDQLQSPRSRSGSSGSTTNSPSKKKCSLPLKSRQLIQSCFNNSHENIGSRILKRSAEKRKDFGRFYIGQNQEQRDRIAEMIKILLKNSVTNIDSADEELQSMATEFGQRFVEFRLFGFKADYFSALADSTITECVLLDAAVHPAKATLNAFSQFITMLFSAVRDGFYNEMRRLRRTSQSFSISSNSSSSRKKLSVDDNLKSGVRTGQRSTNTSPRSISPSPEPSSPRGVESTHSSHEEITFEEQNNNNNASGDSRKGSKDSIEALKAKEELRILTEEFLGKSAAELGKENQLENQ